MRITAIDGNTQRLDGGAMYGNAPRAMWSKWSPPDEHNRILLACRAMLVQLDDGRRVLCETGIGAFFDPKMAERYGIVERDHVLLRNLAAHGLGEDDIDAVVLSHLHFDHAGGLLPVHGEPVRLLFPRAKYYVGERHRARALAPHARDRASFVPELNALLEASGRLVTVGDDGRCDLAPHITFRFSDGHTPGLMLAEAALGDGPVVFAADLVPGVPWVHVPITMGYDRHPELLIEEKRALLEDLVARNGKLFFTHDPDVACGRIVRDAKTGRFSSETVDTNTLR